MVLETVVQEKMAVIELYYVEAGLPKLGLVAFEYGLTQVINGPTRVTHASESQIDLLFAMNPDLIVHSDCSELRLSDHSLIYWVLAEDVDKQDQSLHEVRLFGKCNQDTLAQELHSDPWAVMESLKIKEIQSNTTQIQK